MGLAEFPVAHRLEDAVAPHSPSSASKEYPAPARCLNASHGASQRKVDSHVRYKIELRRDAELVNAPCEKRFSKSTL